MHLQVRFKLCRHYLFYSASFALNQSFNAAFKKENNSEGMFTHQKFPKIDSLPLDQYNIDEKNQALTQLVLVTPAVNFALYLDLWAKKCSSFIFIVISNTISVVARHRRS